MRRCFGVSTPPPSWARLRSLLGEQTQGSRPTGLGSRFIWKLELGLARCEGPLPFVVFIFMRGFL